MKNSMTNENKQNIEMNKEYTRNGKKVRVLCVDNRRPKFPVVVATEDGFVYLYTANGQFYSDEQSEIHDLKEYNHWQDVEVDTKVLCSNNNVFYQARHFAKYKDGEVFVFADGQSSFTSDCGTVPFPYNKLA